MLRHALTLASITLLAAGCGATAKTAPRSAAHVTTPQKSAKTAAPAKETVAAKAEPAEPKADGADSAAASAAAEPVAKTAEPKRKLGDFHVYQYAGKFSKQAITLTEQVVAAEGELLVVDFVFEEGSTMKALRVRMRGDDQVVSVARITADGEVPAALADYDQMMQKTQFIPDSNDEIIGTDHTSCLIGEETVDCDVTTYMVTYGNKHAKLTITKSSRLPGRDIGGDVVAEDGKVLFSARLVERGNQPPVVEALAKLDKFVPDGP